MWFWFNKLIKRILDIVMSIILIIILSPIFLICIIGVKFDSKGPVFFKQARLTLKGRIFYMFKFRSMYINSEQIGTGLFNYENDPRVTKLGRLLRNLSLDELPQLFNVLCGDMSLVGPRPCVSYELGDFETLNHRYKKRFEINAGITGLAQIQGRNELPWDQKVLYDGDYIERFKKWGVLLDIKILFLTVYCIFKKKSIFEDKVDENISDIESAKIANEEIIRKAHEK
ncbi:sugar transferase [Marinilabiliaceae bacterium JC040]|nr:sugar transferase [Marinilabiliaceae bacterium JC040]